MTMAKHTPGPWTYVPERMVADGHVAGNSPKVLHRGTLVALTARRGPSNEGRDPDAEANARLIAAAPLLLAELERAELLLGEDVAADCRWCGGEGGWTERTVGTGYTKSVKPGSPTPVVHKADCPLLSMRAAIAAATGGKAADREAS